MKNQSKQQSSSIKAKILLLDIETAPILAHVWSLWYPTGSPDFIKSDWYILAWAAKWIGEKKVYYKDQRSSKNIEDDSRIVKDLKTLLDEAEVIVTHNGKQFDIKKINARFIAHGILPPSPFLHIDTKEIAKRYFGFTSNKLDHLTKALKCDVGKSAHKKFPGFELWQECMKGNLKAFEEMEKYNIQDVLALESLYLKLRVWGTGSALAAIGADGISRCVCGSTRIIKCSMRYTACGKYQGYKCQECGKRMQGRKNLLTKLESQNLLKEI